MSAETVTLNLIESHLWESANILRGPVDAADFKTYIFPLLFFKRICDVWDEEYREIVEETGDEQLAWFPESHRFQIPETCHWNDVRTKATNVGTALQHAMREIEKSNPDSLYGVFGDAQWSNKDRLSDPLLKDLIEHFSKLSFGNQNVNSDLLGDAYEYLIKKFADATNKKAGEFYTPRALHSGVLLQRLKRGLERIYISEIAWIRAPRIEVTLRALAHRFPERLVLVKADGYRTLARILKVNRVRAAEYQFIGGQLQGQYEDDFGYDKFDNPNALVCMERLRVGDIPRGSRMLWLHELPVGFEQWGELNVDGINELQNQAAERRIVQDKQASDALARTFQADRDAKAAQTLDLSEPSQ